MHHFSQYATGTSFDRVLAALEALGLIAHDRRAEGQVIAHCPCSVHQNGDHDPSLSVTYTDRKVLLHCFAGGSTEEIVSRLGLEMRDLFDDGYSPNGQTDVEYAAEALGLSAPKNMFTELAKLLGLDDLTRAITAVHVYGRGSRAHVRIVLDDDSLIVLDPLGHYMSTTKMSTELAMQAGATPTLKWSDVLKIARLMHDLGEHHAAAEIEDHAADLGSDYLRFAATGEVDMADQSSRWNAFSRLDRSPRNDIVLLDSKTGIRYVRIGWFAEYVRGRGAVAEPVLRALIAIGWRKRGPEGQIKASDPVGSATLKFRFVEVPAGWES